LVSFQYWSLRHYFVAAAAVVVFVAVVDFVSDCYAIVCSIHSHSSLANFVRAFAVAVVVDEYSAGVVVAAEFVYSYFDY